MAILNVLTCPIPEKKGSGPFFSVKTVEPVPCAEKDSFDPVLADLAASFQEAVVDCLVGKAAAALKRTGLRVLCVGGGVAANSRLRQRLQEAADRQQVDLHIAPMRLCTDNAVMGAIAVERWKAGLVENLDLDVLPGVVRKPSLG